MILLLAASVLALALYELRHRRLALVDANERLHSVANEMLRGSSVEKTRFAGHAFSVVVIEGRRHAFTAEALGDARRKAATLHLSTKPGHKTES